MTQTIDVFADRDGVYGNAAGLGLFAAPLALAFTGVGRSWIVVIALAAVMTIVVGVALLRASHRSKYQ